MLPTLFAMLVILAIAAVVVGMVVVGMEGTGRHRLPDVAQTLARAGRHLNGDGEPPKGLVAFFEEAESGAGDLRQLPAALKAMRSAASAKTASTAASARSAASAASASTVESPVEAPAVPVRPMSAWERISDDGQLESPALVPSAGERITVPQRSAWETWSPTKAS